MPDIRVGTRRITRTGTPPGPDGSVVAELQAHWVDIDGVRLTANEHGLKSVTYRANGTEISTVTLVFTVSSFASVPKDE